jgi:hypothetical protein
MWGGKRLGIAMLACALALLALAAVVARADHLPPRVDLMVGGR